MILRRIRILAAAAAAILLTDGFASGFPLSSSAEAAPFVEAELASETASVMPPAAFLVLLLALGLAAALAWRGPRQER